MSTRVFALIIGIDSYKSGAIWNLHSCVEDAKRMKRWLMEGLKVPKDQICVLLDNHATKQRIEDAFTEHLVNNSSIERGDALLIYFAGHGSCLTAPQDWYQHHSRTEIVEVLCPYDHDTKSTEGRIAGISSRSFNAMIEELATSKGNNITVFLDCCFSPIQTTANILDRSITRWTRTVKTVPEDLYRGLWPSARGRPLSSKLGFLQPSGSYTLFAACSAGEKAQEGKEGGRLTVSFLHAVPDLPLHRTSYVQLIERLLQQDGDVQKFLCLGKHKNRILFNDVPFPPDTSFSAVSLDSESGLMEVDLGAIHGVVEGTEFSLHLHNHRCSRNPIIASLVATDVWPTRCFTRIKSRVSEVPKSCWAKVTRWNNRRPLRVYLKTTITSFIRMWNLRRKLPTKPGSIPPRNGVNVLTVKQEDHADVSLTIGARGMTIFEHHPILPGKLKRVVKIQKNDGLIVVDEVARFHLHLHRKNADNPLRNLIEMELYRLDPLTWCKSSPNYFKDGMATISYDKDAIYQVTIHNNSTVDLWPYLVYMDPNHYSISMLYHPDTSSKEPPLPSHGSLDIGSGALGSEALSFALADHNHMDSAYLKLFLSSDPVSMNILEQDPMPRWINQLYTPTVVRPTSKTPIWDTSLAPLIFMRHDLGGKS
jgi:hypothetical protein